MGQFPEDGNFGGFMSNFFFKQKATVAKPMDFDDFYRFVLINHDLGMVRKSILTLSIQKNTFFGTLKLTHFSNFTPTLTLSRSQTFTAGLDLTSS